MAYEDVMAEFQVNCVTKPDRSSTSEHITHIGNNLQGWRLTRESAIRRIESQKEAFFVIDHATGKRAYIAVCREPGKEPYLRTYADGKWNNNLLAQGECDAGCQLVR